MSQTAPPRQVSAVTSPEVLDSLFRTARSASEFGPDPIGTETLQSIYDLMKTCPTAWNQQPLRIVAAHTPEAKERLIPHMNGHNRARVKGAAVSLILAADNDFHRHLDTIFPGAPGLQELFAERTDRAESARFNAAIQIGYLVVAVRAAGLAAGPVQGFDHAAVRDEFFSGRDVSVLLVMNVGWPVPKRRPRFPRLDFVDVVDVV